MTANKQASEEAKNRRSALKGAAIGGISLVAAAVVAGVFGAYDTSVGQQLTANQIQQRLDAAPEGLDSKKPDTRLETVGSLGVIVRDSPSYAPTAVSLLAEFVRHEVPLRSQPGHAKPDCAALPHLPDDVQTALTLLGTEAAERIGVDLHGTELAKADFTKGPHLKAADLDGADLRCADVNHVDLRRANLVGVDFRLANLSGADLTDTQDLAANFAGTNLTGTQVNGPRFCQDGQVKPGSGHETMHYVCVQP